MKHDTFLPTVFYKLSKISLLILFLVSLFLITFLSTQTITCLTVTQNNNAEATAVSSGDALLSILNSTTSESVELTQDITINLGTTDQHGKNNVYSGTFNGNGHTITINGYKKHNHTDAANVYAGLFTGKLSGTFKDVTINYNANLHFTLTNNILTGYSRKEVVEENSFFISAGIIAGLLDTTGKIEKVQLNISENAAFSALGIDGRGSESDINYLGGAGGIAGGFVGTAQGAGKIYHSTLNNNGLISSRAENKNVNGKKIPWGGNSQIASKIEITADNNPCRSIAGGVVGELHTVSNASPTLVNFTLKGNGVIASNLKPSNNVDLTTGYAGNVFGSNRAANFSVDGLLYKSANKSATAPIGTVNKAGTWGGSAGSNLIISNVFKVKADGEVSNNRGKLQILTSYDFTGGSSTTKTAIGENGKQEAGKDGGLFYLGWGFGSHTSTNNINELNPETAAKYKDSSGAAYGTLDYTTINPQGEIILVANVTQTNMYYVSAGTYDDRYDHKYYITVYDDYSLSELNSVSFNFPKNSKNHIVYFFTINSSPMVTSFADVVDDKKTYDRTGVLFSGAPSGTSSLFPGIKWVSQYKDLDNVANSAYDTVGISGSRNVTTHSRVGTYTVLLYRTTDQNQEVPLQDGEVIAGNSSNNPSEVYTYTAPASPLTVQIEQRVITVQTEGAQMSYSKEYDGSSSVIGLRLNEHYLLNGLLPGDESNTYITFDDTLSSFVNSSGVPVSNVTGSGSVNVKLVNCSVNNINYKINPPVGGGSIDIILYNCSITKRTVTLEWHTSDGDVQSLDSDYIFVYNGQRILPSLHVNNAIGSDEVHISSLTFRNSSSTEPYECFDAGTYHARVGILSGADVANYRLPTDQNVINSYSIPFEITPKGIKVIWPENKTFTFNKNPHPFVCTIEDANSAIYERDTVTISTVYKNASNNVVDELRNAGTYSATALKTEGSGRNNYYITNASQTNVNDIKINPWVVNVTFKTGTGSSVQPLVYNGTNYIGSDLGLKVNVSTVNTELSPSYLGLSYKNINGTPITEIKTVGKYNASAYVKNGTEGNLRFLTLNYVINASDNYQEIEVTPKEVSLDFGTLSFVYDSTSKSDNVEVQVKVSDIILGDSVAVNKSWGSDTVINVGTYTLTCSLSNPSYKIRPADITRSITITACSIKNEPLLTVAPIESQSYCFANITPKPTIKYKENLLYKDTDFTLVYSNHKDAGNASIEITGKGNFKDSITTSFTIAKKPLGVNISIPQTLIYDATSKKSEISATLTGVIPNDQTPNISYVFYDASTLALVPEPKTAGNYKVIINFNEVNYSMPPETNRTRLFTILKRELGIQFSAYSNLVFNNEPLSIGVQFDPTKPLAEADAGLVSLKQDHMYGPPTSRVSVGQILNAGSYQTTVTLTGDSGLTNHLNYIITSSNLSNTNAQNCNILNYSVKPKDLIIEFDSTNTRVYNKTIQHIQYSATAGYGPLGTDTLDSIIRLQYTNISGVTTTAVSQTGVYTVTAHSHNNNYKVESTIPNNVQFEITPKPLKAYLVYNSQPLEENMEFIYGGSNQNFANSIGYAYQPGYSFISGDEPRIDKVVHNGQQRIDAAYAVSDSYKIMISLANTEKNYVLLAEGSVLERHFKIKPRPIQVTFGLDNNIVFNGNSNDIQVELSSGVGYVSEGDNYYSGIVEGDNINLGAYVYSFVDKSRDIENTDITYYEPGSKTSYKDCGQYTVKAALTDNSNYYIYTSETVFDEKTFNVTPYSITLIPTNIIKTYGELDNIDSLTVNKTIMIDQTGIHDEPGDGELVIISATLIRDVGEDVGSYYYTGYTYDGSLNYAVSVNTSAMDNNGNVFKFEITERVYSITPKQFSIQWDEWNDSIPILPLVPKETVNVIMPLSTIPVELTYSRTGGDYPDAGSYDIDDVIYDDNPNISFVISGINKSGGKGKYVILGRPVALQIKDFTKVYGKNDPDFYNPSNFNVRIDDLPTAIKSDYLSNPSNFNWPELIRCTRQLGENYIQEGYQISYSFITEEAKNYRLQLYEYNEEDVFETIKDSAILMITKCVVEVSAEDIVYNNIHDGNERFNKIYDGNNRLDQRKISLTPQKRDYLYANSPELFNRGFTISGTFISTTLGETDSDAGENKKIKISFSVNADSANNFQLPEPITMSERGRIDKVTIPITISRKLTGDKAEIRYGDSPSVFSKYNDSESILYEGNEDVQFYINYGKYNDTTYSFVGTDTPSLLNLTFEVVYQDINETVVCGDNIKDVGNYVVKLALKSGANLKNYNVICKANENDSVFNDPTRFSSDFTIIPRTIEVVQSGLVFKKPANNDTKANITNEHFKLLGLLEKDKELVKISYTSKLNESLPDVPNTKVLVNNVYISGGSQSHNYTLSNDSFEIEARILSLAKIKLNKPDATHFNNSQVIVEPIIEYYLPGATLKINDGVIVPGSTDSTLDGYNTTVNIKIYYEGKEGVFYTRDSIPPKNAGIYIVSSEITNDSGYTLRGPTTELEIKKVKPYIELSGNSYQEYGNIFQKFTARVTAEGLNETVNVTYSFANEDGTLPLYPKAGYHTVTAKYNAPAQTELNPFSNYISTEITKEIKISQKQVRVVFDLRPKDIEGNLIDEFVYNGRDKIKNYPEIGGPELGISIIGVAPNDICKPVLQIRKDNQPFTQNQIIDAAQYFVNVGVSNDSYYIAGTSSISFRVKKAVLKVIPVIDKATPAGQKPGYTLQYEGFLPGDSEEDLEGLPSLNLSSTLVGTNIAQPSGGLDSNYEYEYITEEYEIVYEKPITSSNNVMYIILASIAGLIILITIISILSKKSMLKAFTNNRSKRK